jgi:hypothetical protein
MNRSDKHDEDILRQYIDNERIEEAPENFTHTVMTRIGLEAEPLKTRGKIRAISVVPAVSAIITLILIIIAFFLPGNSQDPSTVFRLIQNIDFPVLNISLESLLNINLPVWISYLCIGILFLGIFDGVLFGLFHRKIR